VTVIQLTETALSGYLAEVESSEENGPGWVSRVIRGLVYGAFIYIASLIVMPSSALGLTPQQMVLASVAAGICLSLYFTRRRRY